MEKVSIIILTYNATEYVKRTLETLRQTNYDNYEVIVFDNCSNDDTRNMLLDYKMGGYFDKLILNEENLMFIGGNNAAFDYVASDSKYILLLNADVEIRNKEWLTRLVDCHKTGVTGCGLCSPIDNRPDGWCFLIDTFLFAKYKLDNNRFKVYCSVADLTSKVINDGYSAQTIVDYKNFIYHFGSASGPFAIKSSKEDNDELKTTIWNAKCRIVEKIEMPNSERIHLGKSFYLMDFRRKLIRKCKNFLKKLK